MPNKPTRGHQRTAAFGFRLSPVMVLVTLRASVDGQVLQQVARVVVGEVAIKEPIDLFLSDFDKVFKLRSVHVHSDATWGKPFTDLDLETLDAISAGELAEIGKFLDLVGEARAEPSAATTQKSAFDELKTKLVLPLRSTVDRFDWLIYNALLDVTSCDLHAALRVRRPPPAGWIRC